MAEGQEGNKMGAMEEGQREGKFRKGDKCFAKMDTYPTWPARITYRESGDKKESYWVYFYGTCDSASIKAEKIFPYNEETIGKFGSLKLKKNMHWNWVAHMDLFKKGMELIQADESEFGPSSSAPQDIRKQEGRSIINGKVPIIALYRDNLISPPIIKVKNNEPAKNNGSEGAKEKTTEKNGDGGSNGGVGPKTSRRASNLSSATADEDEPKPIRRKLNSDSVSDSPNASVSSDGGGGRKTPNLSVPEMIVNNSADSDEVKPLPVKSTEKQNPGSSGAKRKNGGDDEKPKSSRRASSATADENEPKPIRRKVSSASASASGGGGRKTPNLSVMEQICNNSADSDEVKPRRRKNTKNGGRKSSSKLSVMERICNKQNDSDYSSSDSE